MLAWVKNVSETLKRWSSHPRALFYLGFVAFIEASLFPFPPDIILLPMTLVNPQRIWFYVKWTTFFSVLGGAVGYLLGFFVMDLLYPVILQWGYGLQLSAVKAWFLDWGAFAIVFAGLTPLPYKLFTLSAGALHLPLMSFLAASVLGRGLRYTVVTLLVTKGKSVGTALGRFPWRVVRGKISS